MAGKKKNKSVSTARKGKNTRAKAKNTLRKTPAKKAKAPKNKAPKNKVEEIVQPVLNAAKLKELYATMMKCRMLAERMQQKHPSSHTISGLEATLVGAGAHLLPQDCVAMEHGGFAASLIKGTPINTILARMTQGHADRDAENPGAFVNPTATTASMATGLSLAREKKGQNTATLMFGTQRPGKDIFEAEAMALAATEKLPIVCLVESNFDARAETHSLPVASSSHEATSAYYPRITVDGADVVAVFRVTQEAIRRAREGHGPALIECMTSRMNGAAANSDSGKTERHVAEDPLPFMEKYLRRRNLWSADWSRRLVKDFTKELDSAFASAHEKPSSSEAFDNVYSTDFGRINNPARAS